MSRVVPATSSDRAQRLRGSLRRRRARHISRTSPRARLSTLTSRCGAGYSPRITAPTVLRERGLRRRGDPPSARRQSLAETTRPANEACGAVTEGRCYSRRKQSRRRLEPADAICHVAKRGHASEASVVGMAGTSHGSLRRFHPQELDVSSGTVTATGLGGTATDGPRWGGDGRRRGSARLAPPRSIRSSSTAPASARRYRQPLGTSAWFPRRVPPVAMVDSICLDRSAAP